MANSYFKFKQFTVFQDRCQMKVTTDSCLFGAWVASKLQQQSSTGHLLDIGSGSGLLSLMIAQQYPGFIEGIEIQKADYLQSLENIATSPFSDRIQIHNADIRTAPLEKSYQVIVSNPPFYEQDLKSPSAAKSLAHHDTGLKLHELLPLIKTRLAPGGSFFLLLPAKRTKELTDLTRESGLFISESCLVKQTERHAGFRIMIRGGFETVNPNRQEIIIRQSGKYSPAFVQLLSDYYLYL